MFILERIIIIGFILLILLNIEMLLNHERNKLLFISYFFLIVFDALYVAGAFSTVLTEENRYITFNADNLNLKTLVIVPLLLFIFILVLRKMVFPIFFLEMEEKISIYNAKRIVSTQNLENIDVERLFYKNINNSIIKALHFIILFFTVLLGCLFINFSTFQLGKKEVSNRYEVYSFSPGLQRVTYLDEGEIIYTNVPFEFEINENADKPCFYRVDKSSYNSFCSDKWTNKNPFIKTETTYYVKLSTKDYNKISHYNDFKAKDVLLSDLNDVNL